jgi:hypothetical protein
MLPKIVECFYLEYTLDEILAVGYVCGYIQWDYSLLRQTLLLMLLMSESDMCRYGENVVEANQNEDWECPVCRKICNCSSFLAFPPPCTSIIALVMSL